MSVARLQEEMVVVVYIAQFNNTVSSSYILVAPIAFAIPMPNNPTAPQPACVQTMHIVHVMAAMVRHIHQHSVVHLCVHFR